MPVWAWGSAVLTIGVGAGLAIGLVLRETDSSSRPPAQTAQPFRTTPPKAQASRADGSVPPAIVANPSFSGPDSVMSSREQMALAEPVPAAPAPPSVPAPAAAMPAPALVPPQAVARPTPAIPGASAAPSARPQPPARQQMAFAPPPDLPPAPGGTPPWIANAVAAPDPAGKPYVAIVIDDMGLDRKRSARAVSLPAPLTLSYLPYGNDLPDQTATARRHGHELLVHVPMQPLAASKDAGPEVLNISLSQDEVARRLEIDLSKFQGFVGINNHMGSKFTADVPGMSAVIASLRQRGLFWLDSRTTAHSVGSALASAYQVPSVDRDVFLDDVPTAGGVKTQLAALEALVKRRGSGVAIGHPKDATLDQLSAWLAELPAKGITLVPLSYIVRQRNEHHVPQAAAALQ